LYIVSFGFYKDWSAFPNDECIRFGVSFAILRFNIKIPWPLGLITVKVPKETSKEIVISAVELHGKSILEKSHNIVEDRLHQT
jgi:hypothetical protein